MYGAVCLTGASVTSMNVETEDPEGDDSSVVTEVLWSSGFEEFSEGTHPKNSSPSHFLYGGEEGDDESAVVASAWNFNASCGLPSPFTSCGAKAFMVNTGTSPVWISPYETTSGGKLGGRYVPEPGTVLSIDAIAQFTVTPEGDDVMMGSMPEVQDGGASLLSIGVTNRVAATQALVIARRGLVTAVDDKLLLYMQEGTTANNWCLLAGIDTDDGEIAEQRFTLQSADPANPIPEADPNACVRVTVKAINDAETGRLEFEVYLNGALASANGRTRFLPHPDATDRTGVSAIGFAGEGTVDNIAFSVGAVSDDSGEGSGTNDVVATRCEVTAVAVKPRWPWNGIVDIDFTLAIEPASAKAMVSVTGCDTVKNQTILPKASLEGTEEPVGAGSHRISWDIGAEYPQFHSEAFRVEVTAMPVTNQTQEAGLYMVIDLSGGTNAPAYPVSYLNEVPVGGWTTEHKTTKLVMRRIEPGTFVMNDKYNVTLTKPFYMGVYEVTQKQYELVTGNKPSIYKGDARPVERVSWNTIRGDSDIYNWPSNRTVDAASFMGIIRQKTGLGLDLPTEAQWEYACRAGTTSAYNNGGSTTNDLNVLGRYSGNRNDGKGGYSEHTTVGSYLPNAWGLYDMHGNVREWCLDWYLYGSSLNGTDPEGPASGADRILRCGSWNLDAGYCASSFRRYYTPSHNLYSTGFRLACSAGL